MSTPKSASNPMVVGSMAAMRRAALRARQIARDTGTPLVVVRDGKVVEIKLPPKTSGLRGKRKVANDPAAALHSPRPKAAEGIETWHYYCREGCVAFSAAQSRGAD